MDRQAKIYIENLFKQYKSPALVYHNYAHTCNVVAHTREIIAHCSIPEEGKFILINAAWFHDTGHLIGSMDGHEIASVALMREFMQSVGVDESTQQQIGDCILATQMPTHPQLLTHKIICDADSYHLGTPAFFAADEQVRRELELRESKVVVDWDKRSLEFLKQHQYFTEYCKEILDPGKRMNIMILERKIG